MGRTHRLAALAVAGLLAGSFAAAAAPAPVTLDDVVALLKAHVGDALILKQIEASSSRLTLGVQEILRLKEAGASDALIEALMEAGPADASETPAAFAPLPGEGPPSFRIIREQTEDGQEVLHITNLDASGRRMGGEIPPEEKAPPNRYESGRESRPPAVEEPDYDGPPAAPAAPVVVNVYPPEAPAPAVYGSGYDAGYVSPYMYRDPYAYRYPRGRVPGYFRGGYCGVHGVWAPPGSYTHFRLHHTHYGGRQVTGFGTGSPAGALRTSVGPNFAPIGPAMAFDRFYRGTQAGYRR